jgi:filamentous hemagglutinin
LGQAFVEVKTFDGPLTGNQTDVFPDVQNGTASGFGKNAQSANMFGKLLPTPVIIIKQVTNP